MPTQKPRQLLETLRFKREEYEIEPFVLDFLEMWQVIHERTKEASLDDLWDILQSMETSYTLPFYEKYKEKGSVELNEVWFRDFLSITLWWGVRGGMLFPSNLIAYEILNHKEQLLEAFTKRILTKEIEADVETLYEFIFPILFHFYIPLDEIDIEILRAFQVMARQKYSVFKEPSYSEFSKHLNLSTKTFRRKNKVLDLLQMKNGLSFVDMGRLGYETTLLIHTNPFPDEYRQYLLFSTDLTIGKYSVVQIPLKKTSTSAKLRKNLELLNDKLIHSRISSWNLSQLVTGDDRWRDPVPLLNVKRDTTIHSSPDLTFSLIPPDKLFRPLTPADIKIIDFISIEGHFHNTSHLSQTINVSRTEVHRRLKEYSEEKLLVLMYNYSNIGLDTTLFFFLSTEISGRPWVIHNLLSFPRVDVFFLEDQLPHLYFGFLRLPNKWLKPFSRQVDLLTQDTGVKFYYKHASRVDFARWGISRYVRKWI